MDDFEFLLKDRIGVIRSVNEKYDLESNSYLSFSGGKDSTILHHLLDMALPGNHIPRVYIDTGIEYELVREFVYSLKLDDPRIEIIKPSVPVMAMLRSVGYPFKSKEHSLKVGQWQHGSRAASIVAYKDGHSSFSCPLILRYQFDPSFGLKLSNGCCYKLKKDPVHKWESLSNRHIVLTGMRHDEGGQRSNIKGCVLTDHHGRLKKFHPLLVVDDSFEDSFVNRYGIKLCPLYYPPYCFKRTGCKGCPYSLDLQDQLTLMALYLPKERAQCEVIWKPVYDEYRRIGFRLDKNEQLTLF